MNPQITFFFGLLLLVVFGWYFATDLGRRKRILGTVLTVLMVAFCIQSIVPPDQKLHLGLDLQGGTSFLIRLDKPQVGALDKDSVTQAVEVIRKRVDQYGVSEPVITPEGADRILVQIPGLDEAKIKTVRDTLQQVAKLEFRYVRPDSRQILKQIDAGTMPIPPGYTIVKDRPENGPDGKPLVPERYIVKLTADMTGDHVTGAVEGGIGCSILPRFVCAGAIEQGRIVEVHPVSDLIPGEPWFASFRAGDMARLPVAEFVGLFDA